MFCKVCVLMMSIQRVVREKRGTRTQNTTKKQGWIEWITLNATGKGSYPTETGQPWIGIITHSPLNQITPDQQATKQVTGHGLAQITELDRKCSRSDMMQTRKCPWIRNRIHRSQEYKNPEMMKT